MKHIALVVIAIFYCLVFFSKADGQQGKGRTKPQQKVSQPNRDTGQPTTNLGIELIEAAKAGNLERVKVLLSKGVDPNTRGKEDATPLIIASARGHIEVVKLLLDKGAQVNAQDASTMKLTSLMVAAFRGHARLVELLLDKGADPNIKDWREMPAMNYAAVADHKPIAELIYKGGGKFRELGIVDGILWIPLLPADGKCFEHLEQPPCGSGANPSPQKKN